MLGVARLNVLIERAKLGTATASGLPDVVTPFNLGGVGRTALVAANNHRSTPLTDAALVDLCARYANILDPGLQSPSSDLRSIFGRLAYEQFTTAYSAMENIARTQALLIDGLGDGALPTEREWLDALGVGLQQFVQIGFSMNVAALSNEGRIDRDVLRMDHVSPIFTPLTADEALRVVDQWFASSPGRLRQEGLRAERAGFEKQSFNPLQAKPIVALPEGRYVMPWPRLIIDRFTLPGLYFIGLDAFGTAFTDALGERFEQYIGHQLDQLQHGHVEGEICYGSPEKRTVDFFVITDEVVVLVEVKSSRPIEATRLGLAEGDEDTVRKVGKAFEQIDASADLIRRSNPAVSHIPTLGRDLCGLVVTAEPFQLVNSKLYDDVLKRPVIPTTVVCSHDLERFVARTATDPGVGSILSEAIVQNPHRWLTLDEASRHLPHRSNTLLVAAYERILPHGPRAGRRA